MKRSVVLVVASLGMGVASVAACCHWETCDGSRANDLHSGWKPATFHGLELGRATKGDVIGVLGAPDRIEEHSASSDTESCGEEWLIFDSPEGEPGAVTAVLGACGGALSSIDIPVWNHALSEDAIRDHFGDEGKLVRYRPEDCDADDETGPVWLVEDPVGDVAVLEFRERGIVVLMNSAMRATHIRYLSKAFGREGSVCSAISRMNPLPPSGHVAKWTPAVFLGLRLGEATRSDVVAALGSPSRTELNTVSVDSEPYTEEWLIYDFLEGSLGRTTMAIEAESSRLVQVSVDVDDLSVDDISRAFGDDYRLGRYWIEDCFSDGGDSGLLVEAADGNVEVLEYREKGIAVFLRSANEVQYIEYESGPIAVEKSGCAGQTSKPKT